jgi:hypothetical protein
MVKSDARTVHPHEPIVELAENLWCVQGDVPGAPIKRRMTIAKLSDGGLVIHNAMLLKKADMKRIEAWGEPRYVVVPNAFHRLDVATFKERYPDAEIVCPRNARTKVEEKAPVDLTYADVPDDELVTFEHLDGTDDREGVLRVESSDGTTLVFNDVLFNMSHLPGFLGFILKAIGSTGGPKVTNIAKLIVIKQAAELRGHLERLAQPNVVRLVPGHGDVIESEADEILYRTAVRL